MVLKKLFLFFIVSIALPLYSAKVVVIGAGLAGLTAGYRLKQSGHDVEIYEARKRPGGCILTAKLGEHTIELGGEGITGEALQALVDELHLPCYFSELHRDFSLYTSDGTLIDLYTLFKNAQEPTQELYALLGACSSLEEVLTILCAGQPLLKEFLALRMRCFEGQDIQNLSMFYFDSLWYYYCLNYKNLIKGETITFSHCRLKGGMSSLIEALCAKLAGCIEYEMPLKKILKKEDSLTLLVGDRVIDAQKVILAMPCSTLKDVAIEDGIIPQDQVNFIGSLQYGADAKIFISVQGESSRTSGANENCMMSYEKPFVMLYFGGSKGIFNHISKKEVQDKIFAQVAALKTLYPGLKFKSEAMPLLDSENTIKINENAVGISWINEQYSKGSYSCLAPGQEKVYNEFSEYRGVRIRNIFRPIDDTIFFAGEHTSLDNPSTMEGAVESGYRAALMIQALLKDEY